MRRYIHFGTLFAMAAVCALASPLSGSEAGTVSHHYFRRYQATAYITVLSVNVWSRSGVGFGHAQADEETTGLRRNISLQFLSGSIPEKAHNLNRFGFIQEDVKERDHICSEARYFGLITANGEESFAQAKAAMQSKASTAPFIAAQASIDTQSARYSIRHMLMSSAYRGVNVQQLLSQVRASFDRPEEGQPEHRQALEGEGMGTFLYSVREAMVEQPERVEKRFIYNGKIFRMVAEKREDVKVGHELHDGGLIDNPADVVAMNGAIRNEKTNEVTNFRLWFDRATPDLLPLRFEFRPKSYLRLVFQAEAATVTQNNMATSQVTSSP